MFFNLFILVFIISFIIFAWFRLEWSVLFILATLPSYLIRFKVGVPITLLEVMILIAFFVWFIKQTNFILFLQGKYGWKDLKMNKAKRMKYPFGIEICLLLIVSYIAVAIAGFNNAALGVWKAYFFEPLLVFILVLNLFNDNMSAFAKAMSDKNDANDMRMTRINGIEKIILALSVSAFFVSVFAIYQKFTGAFIDNPFWAAEATRRVTSFFDYPNAVGLYLAPLVMVMVGYLFSVIASPDASGRGDLDGYKPSSRLLRRFTPRNDKIKVIFLVLTILLSLLSIYFAKSEGAIVGLGAGVVVFGLLAGKNLRRVTVGLLVCVFLVVGFYAPLRAKVIEKVTLSDLSGEIRKQQWRETFQMMKGSKIIMGTGLSGYQAAIKPYHQEGIFFNFDNNPKFRNEIVWGGDSGKKKYWQPVEIYMYPHNIIFNFWTELGVAGALLFVWIIGKFAAINIKLLAFGDFKNKFLVLGLFCTIVVVIVHGLVDVPYFKNDLSVMFWVFVALLSLIYLKKEEIEKTN